MPAPFDTFGIVQLPRGWRRLDLPNGTAFADGGELDAHDGDVSQVPLTLFASALDAAGRSVQQVADDLMSRRVRQGHPGRFDASISGLSALGFDWSDGITEILSYFVVHRSGWIVEFQVARAFYPAMYTPGFDPPSLRSIADELLAGVHWHTAPNSADPSGNRR